MPVLPIATSQSAGGVQVADQNDIVAENGVIRTAYQDRLTLGADAVFVGQGAPKLGTPAPHACVAVGALASATDHATAVGKSACAAALSATALGESASVDEVANYSVALGSQASVMRENSVALGHLAEANEPNVVAVGSILLRRRIVHVENGRADDDAVTMAQLSAQSAQISELSEHMNGPIAAYLLRLETALATLSTRLDALEQGCEGAQSNPGS